MLRIHVVVLVAALLGHAVARADEALAEFKFTNDGDVLFVPLEIAGQRQQMLLDTGATFTVFDKRSVSLLPGPFAQEKAGTSGNPIVIDLHAAPQASVGPLQFDRKATVASANLAHWQPFFDEMHGFLGMEFLRSYIVQLDFERGRVAFFSPATAPEPDWGEAFELTYDRRDCPHVYTSVNGTKNRWFGIDTGMNATAMISPQEVEHSCTLANIRAVGTVQSSNVDPTGQQQVMLVRINEFSLGPFTHNDLVFSVGNQCLLGMHYLRRFRVTFDFPRNKLYLKPNRDYAAYDYTDKDGFDFNKVGTQWVVTFCPQKVSAYAAGVRVNDVVLAIDDQMLADLPYHQFRKVCNALLLRQHAVKLTLQRGERVLQVLLPRSGAHEEHQVPAGTESGR